MKLTIEEIKQIIPHRYPFLFVDGVTEIVEGKSCTAIKNLSINEHFFQGHFKGNPIVPGVLIIEALAQTIALAFPEASKDFIFLLVGVEKAIFKKSAVPGDQLILKSTLISKKLSVYIIDGKAYVRDLSGKEFLCASATIKIYAYPKNK